MHCPSQESRQEDSALHSLITMAHFYASQGLGWMLYQSLIYPHVQIASIEQASMIPVYILNVMAYGCLVYVATKPFVIVGIELGRRVRQVIGRYSSSPF
jgi:hypothetical protein